MIKLNDRVVPKYENEIKFSTENERIRYNKYKELGYFEEGSEYSVYMRLTERDRKRRRYYVISVKNIKSGKRNSFKMTWFRKKEMHMKMNRRKKIDTIFK